MSFSVRFSRSSLRRLMQACCRRGLLLRPSASIVPVRSAFSSSAITMRPSGPSQHGSAKKRARNYAAVRCSSAAATAAATAALPLPPPLPADAQVPAPPPADLDSHVANAWEWWQSIGAPKYHVAPMVDQVNRKRDKRGGGRERKRGRCRKCPIVSPPLVAFALSCFIFTQNLNNLDTSTTKKKLPSPSSPSACSAADTAPRAPTPR